MFYPGRFGYPQPFYSPFPSYPYGRHPGYPPYYAPRPAVPPCFPPFYPPSFPGASPYPPQPMLSQIMSSPQRNFQSPDRVNRLTSPQRNALMQSQQVPKSPVVPSQQQQQPPQLQSPQRQFLTYEQVMERIRNAQQNQQQPPQQPPSQQRSYQQPSKPNHNYQNQQNPQQKLYPQAQPPPDEDLDRRYQNALKSTKEIIKKYSGDESGKKPQSHQSEDDQQHGDQQFEEDADEIQDLALQYEDGYIYRGQGIPPSTRNGFGQLSDQDGNEVYAGYWKDNLYQGQGRLTNLQKEEMNGPLDWNDMTSIGNGWEQYEGNFVAGKMHGIGTLVLSNGEKYMGEFEDGMVHGEGEFTTVNQELIKGQWDQGILQKLTE